MTFAVDAFPTDLFHGRVSTVRLNPTTVQNVVTYNTVIDFSNPDEKLLPGETAYVTIPTGKATNVVEIPNPALTFKPRCFSQRSASSLQAVQHLARAVDDPSRWLAGRLEARAADKHLIPVAVQVGITDYNNTQLIHGDLHEGDALVIAATPGSRLSRRTTAAGIWRWTWRPAMTFIRFVVEAAT